MLGACACTTIVPSAQRMMPKLQAARLPGPVRLYCRQVALVMYSAVNDCGPLMKKDGAVAHTAPVVALRSARQRLSHAVAARRALDELLQHSGAVGRAPVGSLGGDPAATAARRPS